MPLLFAVTLFVSASLLFMVQPMVGKMVLPLLGGSPAVWNTCMVFFQALLLLGYLYAHHVTSRYEPTKQWAHPPGRARGCRRGVRRWRSMLGARHTPIAIAESLAPPGESQPDRSACWPCSTVAIGMPFFVVSTSAPLLQKWFAVHRPPVGPRPVLPVRRQQRRQPDLAARLPAVHRAEPDARGQAWLLAVGFVRARGADLPVRPGGGEPDRRAAARRAAKPSKAGKRAAAAEPAGPVADRAAADAGRGS